MEMEEVASAVGGEGGVADPQPTGMGDVQGIPHEEDARSMQPAPMATEERMDQDPPAEVSGPLGLKRPLRPSVPDKVDPDDSKKRTMEQRSWPQPELLAIPPIKSTLESASAPTTASALASQKFYEAGPGVVAIFSVSDDRPGNEADIEKVKDTYARLGNFEVLNFSLDSETFGQNIWEVIRKLQRKDRLTGKSYHQSLTTILMAHGSKTSDGIHYVMDVKGRKMFFHTKFIKNYMMTRHIPDHFKGKPKILLLQSCRGKQNNTKIKGKAKKDNADSSFSEADGEGDDSGEEEATMKDEHSYVLCATVEGTKAYRKDDGSGSYFIQSFCRNLLAKPHVELEELRRLIHAEMKASEKAFIPEVIKNNMRRMFRYQDPPPQKQQQLEGAPELPAHDARLGEEWAIRSDEPAQEQGASTGLTQDVQMSSLEEAEQDD